MFNQLLCCNGNVSFKKDPVFACANHQGELIGKQGWVLWKLTQAYFYEAWPAEE